jgi:hypothetical protein
MQYRWVDMDGNEVFQPQIQASFAFYIVQQLVPQDGCVLDVFSGGAFSRAALLQEKKSVALEDDDRKVMFLQKFFGSLRKLATVEDAAGYADQDRGEPSGTAKDAAIMKEAVVPVAEDLAAIFGKWDDPQNAEVLEAPRNGGAGRAIADVHPVLDNPRYAEVLERMDKGETYESMVAKVRRGINDMERDLAREEILEERFEMLTKNLDGALAVLGLIPCRNQQGK